MIGPMLGGMSCFVGAIGSLMFCCGMISLQSLFKPFLFLSLSEEDLQVSLHEALGAIGDHITVREHNRVDVVSSYNDV